MEKRVREGKGEDSRAVRDNRPYQVALSEFSQRFPDEIAGGERGVQAGEGFLRLGRFVTEGEEGEKSVLGISSQRGRRSLGGSAAGEGVEGGKFVAKFENDPFGRLFA
jgi:hypothetical protein